MFACAAWNGDTLRLLVYPLASTPLHYRWNERLFAFSSPFTLLLALDSFPSCSCTERGLAQFLCWGRVLKGQTVYDGIGKMQTAGLMGFCFVGPSVVKRKYWALRFEADDENTRAVDRAAEPFSVAVDRTLRMAVEPTCAAL